MYVFSPLQNSNCRALTISLSNGVLSNEAEELWTSVFIKRNMTALRRKEYINEYRKSAHEDITFSVQRFTSIYFYNAVVLNSLNN